MQVQIWISLTFPSFTFSTNRSRRVWRLIVKEIDLCSVQFGLSCTLRFSKRKERLDSWRWSKIDFWMISVFLKSIHAKSMRSFNEPLSRRNHACSLSLSLSCHPLSPQPPGPSVSQSVSPTCAQRGRETPRREWSGEYSLVDTPVKLY